MTSKILRGFLMKLVLFICYFSKKTDMCLPCHKDLKKHSLMKVNIKISQNTSPDNYKGKNIFSEVFKAQFLIENFFVTRVSNCCRASLPSAYLTV